jgi:predicted DNA-binding protein (MmcQ/YjbR family)
MTTDSLRAFCLSLPHATEDVKWGNDLCFSIADKMFTVACLDRADGHAVSFKCEPEKFTELIEMEGIIPAPYMARNHWVTLERFDALRDSEIKQLVTHSYQLVLQKLPKKTQSELGNSSASKKLKNAVKSRRAKA